MNKLIQQDMFGKWRTFKTKRKIRGEQISNKNLRETNTGGERCVLMNKNKCVDKLMYVS